MLPLTPATPAFDDCSRTLPLLDRELWPVRIFTSPPVLSCVFPADKYISPPTPLDPKPTLTYTEPPAPDVLSPDPMYTEPLLPLVDSPEPRKIDPLPPERDVPVLRISDPLEPWDPAMEVSTAIEPLEDVDPYPLLTNTWPPDADWD